MTSVPRWRQILTSPSGAQCVCDRAVLVALFVLAALVMSKNSADPDLWGHWQYGIDAIRHGPSATATYTYTVPEHQWVNHEWVTEWLLAVGWQSLGPRGLLIMKWAAGWLLLVVMYRRARAVGFTAFASASWMLMIGVNLMLFWSLRPQVLSFLMLAVVLALLDAGFRRDARTGEWQTVDIRYGRLLLIPIVLALWCNTHGAFAAGLAVTAVHLTLRAAQIIRYRGKQGLGDAAALASIILVTCAATLVNPHGWRLHQWLVDSLSHPRPEILEWLPPELFSVVWLPFWLWTAGCVASAVLARRRVDLAEGAVLMALLWQAVSHHRHVPLFVIASAWWLGHCWRDAAARLASLRATSASQARPAVLWLVTAVSISATLFFTHALWQRSQAIEVHSRWYPVDAFAYISRHNLQGRMVVQFKWAQYALAAFGNHDDPNGTSGTTVAFDGRFRTCYPQWVVDMYFDFAKGLGPSIGRYRGADSPSFDSARILSFHHPDLVLIDRNVAPACETMRRHSNEWVLLYRDGVAELWGRKSRYGNERSGSYIPPKARVHHDAIDARAVPFPAFPLSERSRHRDERRRPAMAARKG